MYLHKTIIIIGGGHAGFQMASSLRQDGFQGRLIIFDKQSLYPYQRPPLSKSYLLGEIELEKLYFRNKDFYKINNIEIIFEEITTILKEKKAILYNNQIIYYDELVLALGAIPKQIEILNSQNKNVCYISDLKSTLHLKKILDISSNIAIIGGGFIGLEFASVARKLGKNVDVIVKDKKLMNRSTSHNISNIIENQHLKNGIKFHFESKIKEINISTLTSSELIFASGKKLKFDLLVIGIGSVANDTLASNSGLATDQGVLVDEYLCSSEPHIYAIGDCAKILSTFNIYNRLESVQNAVDQAKYLSSILTGKNFGKYDSIPWFWSDQSNMKIQIVGIVNQENYCILQGTSINSGYINYSFDSYNKLVSVETINSIVTHMAARKLFTNYKDNLPDLDELNKYSFNLVELVKSR